MVCIYCSSHTQVVNSRHQRRANAVWRRRRCIECTNIFSTLENADYEKSWVVRQADGTLVPFLRDKLLVSIYNSCQHRPQALQDAIGLSNTVLTALLPEARSSALPASVIANHILTTLRRFDTAAATHYQAFHPQVL